MRKFKIELDSFCEDIFYELENLSEGHKGHEFAIEAEDSVDAANLTADRLLPFLRTKLINYE